MEIEITLADLADFSVTTGDIYNKNDIFFVVTNDNRLLEDPEDDHSYFVRLDSSEIIMMETWPVRSQARSSLNPSQILSVGLMGNIRLTDCYEGGDDESPINDSFPAAERPHTIINEIKYISNSFYVIGTRRAVFKRTSPSSWENIGEGCYSTEELGHDFYDITGNSDHPLYAVGSKGEIWSYNGAWTQEESGTNLDLNTCCISEDGMIYAAGSQGIILCGKDGAWREVGESGGMFEYWSIAEYKNEIYLTANLSLILKLNKENGSVEPVDYGDGYIPSTAYHLKVRDGILYCFGPKDICRFDGETWEGVLSL